MVPSGEDDLTKAGDSRRAQRLLEGLNGPQREAVTHQEGPLLILAGAGSGKTRVLTHRIAFLLFTGAAQPSQILAITFTNKAAIEMRQRVESLIGPRTRGMWLMTFHAACARLLRANAQLLGYTPSFTICDQADSRRLVKRSLEQIGADSKRFAPALVQSRISAAKNRLLQPGELAEQAGGDFEELVSQAFTVYQRELEQMNAVDFDDLLLLAVRLLARHPEVRDRYRDAFQHVLVDEYQDTNHAQYRLLQLLTDGAASQPADRDRPASASAHRNLAVVGDDSQSVYGFRGAQVSNILDFEKDFPDAKVVKLEQNYRSTNFILSAANAVIANNRGGIPKRLWSELGEGEPITLTSLQDERTEASFVVSEVQRLLDEGTARSEIAILYRTNALGRSIEEALTRARIEYQVVGGAKFYERAEVKDLIAYLTFLTNPYDLVSFERIVRSPRRGIGEATVAKVVAHAASVGISVWEAACAPEQVPGLGPAAVKALRRFMETMTKLRSELEGGVSVGPLIESVLLETGYLEALEHERTFEAAGRIENLEQLIDAGHDFDKRSGDDELDLGQAAMQADPSAARADPLAAGPQASPLQRFLEEVSLRGDADGRRDEDGLVTLMTLHNAKGLEYPIVFITALEEGVFPHMRAIDAGELEEERRLFYVGITRAMRQLHLTFARSRRVFGELTASVQSSFLEEIPEHLLRLQERGFAMGGSSLSIGPSAQKGFYEERGSPAHSGFSAHSGLSAQVGSSGRRGFSAQSGFSARGGNGAARERWAASSDAGRSQTFRLGDDVIHASLGEGVVTGVETDGVIVVRFANDGSERKLITEYAPVSRR